MRQKNLNILDSLSHNYFRASIHCKLAHHFFLLDYFCVIEIFCSCMCAKTVDVDPSVKK